MLSKTMLATHTTLHNVSWVNQRHYLHANNIPSRIVMLDRLKAIAICLVILLHSVAFLQNAVPQFSSVWYFMVTVNAACRMAVPLFVMISGAVLMVQWHPMLHPYQGEQVVDCNNENPLRLASLGRLISMYQVVFSRLIDLLVPLLLATVFYSAWHAFKVDMQYLLSLQTTLSADASALDMWQMLLQRVSVSLPAAVLQALRHLFSAGGSYYHLWYLWLFIGLLLVSPWLALAAFRAPHPVVEPATLASPLQHHARSSTTGFRPTAFSGRLVVLSYMFSLLYLLFMLSYPVLEIIWLDPTEHQHLAATLVVQMQSYSWLTSIPWWFWWPAFLGFFVHGMRSGYTFASRSALTSNALSDQDPPPLQSSGLTPAVDKPLSKPRTNRLARRYNCILPFWIFIGTLCISVGYMFEVWWQTQQGWFVGYNFQYSALGVTIVSVLTWRYFTQKVPFPPRPLPESRGQGLAAWLARHSLGIYLCHVLFLEIWQQLWVWFGKPGIHHLFFMGLVVICHAVLTLCCSTAFIWLLTRLVHVSRTFAKKHALSTPNIN